MGVMVNRIDTDCFDLFYEASEIFNDDLIILAKAIKELCNHPRRESSIRRNLQNHTIRNIEEYKECFEKICEMKAKEITAFIENKKIKPVISQIVTIKTEYGFIYTAKYHKQGVFLNA